ncbi:MAG: hypothetical protein IT310_11175 [Anaerolineales bacterium]|nr:hypothetical protein [Anaerolineales bacterium]
MNHTRSGPRPASAGQTFFQVVYYLGVFAFFAFCVKSETYRLGPAPSANANVADVAQTNLLFHDDFQNQLNPLWAWENEDASRWRINQRGWLEITGGDQSVLAGAPQSNLLWLPAPKINLIITTRLKTQPLFNYQQSGLLLFNTAGRYISLSRGYCQECVLGGSGIFLEHNLEGKRVRLALPSEATELSLMFIQTNASVGAFYALETGNWQNFITLQNPQPLERVGLSVTNDSAWEEGYDVIGQFDYFEMRPLFHQIPMPHPGYFQQTANF